MISKNLPNILSLLRIVMSPFFVIFMIQDEPYYLLLSLLLIFLVSLTDFFDGYYARKYSLITEIGKYLDPLADKIFVITVFFTFNFILGNDIFPLWMVALILLRDIFITILRKFYKSKKIHFTTSALAKKKTMIQVVCMHLIILILISNRFSILLIDYDYIYYVMFFCTCITLLSGFDYIYQYYSRTLSLLTLYIISPGAAI